MAESNSHITTFKTKKGIFDKIFKTVLCSICNIVPRETPIFQDQKGAVICSSCQPSISTNREIYQSFHMENLLMELPTSCKYQRNCCPIVHDRNNIAYHEEDCQYRDVLCPYRFCKRKIPVRKLKNHYLDTHGFNLDSNIGSNTVTPLDDSYIVSLPQSIFQLVLHKMDISEEAIRVTWFIFDKESKNDNIVV